MRCLVSLLLIATCVAPAAAADPWPGLVLPAHPAFDRGTGRDLAPADAARAADELLAEAQRAEANGAAAIEAPARLMRGLARYRLGRYRDAAADLALAGQGPLQNADVAAFFHAESLFQAGAYADALAAFRDFERTFAHSTWRHRAAMRVIDCRLGLGEHAGGAKALQAALDAYPEFPHRAAIRYAIAEAWWRHGALDKAAQWFAAIPGELPGDPMVPVARRALDALEAQGAAPPGLSVAAAYARGVDLRERKYFEQALATLQPLLTDRRATSGDRWRARYQIGRTLYQMERYAESHATFAGLIADAPTGRQRGWARYWAAYSLERLGRPDEAAALLMLAMGSDPKKPSGEALHAIGWLYFESARYVEAAKHLDAAAKKGRQWRQTPWQRAWLAYRLGKLDVAAKAFDAMRRSSRYAADRYGYWLARTQARQGEVEAARASYQRVMAGAPLSYYAYQARSRLAELDQPLVAADVEGGMAEGGMVASGMAADDITAHGMAADGIAAVGMATLATEGMAAIAAKGLAAIAAAASRRPPVVITQTTPPDPVPILAELARRYGGALSDLAAAHELAVIGETRWAMLRLRRVSRELRAFGQAGSRARRVWSYVDEPYVDYRKHDRPRAEWGRVVREKGPRSDKKRIAFLGKRRDADYWTLMRDAFAALGDHHYARRHARKEDRVSGAPEGPANGNWQRRYARAFRELVEPHAAHYGLDPHFIWALMTVESTYNPWAISRASARGLMQVMPHTGALVADRMQWRNFGPALLFEPEVATEMAAWYFHQLLRKFDGQLPLAIAGYNAGPHRVAWWLSRKGHLPMDEFVEEIPFTEAREYTKKVLRHLALYRRTWQGDDGLEVGQVIDPAFRDNINF